MPDDTHPKVEAMMLERYRRMSPAEKLQRVQQMGLSALLRRAYREAGLAEASE